MALYGPIGGTLPWGGSGTLPTAGPGLGGQYASAYQAALGQNKTNYSNILQGYQQTLASQQAAQQQTLQGYRNLQGNMLGTLEGAGRERGLQIGEQAAQQRGSILSQLVGSGLGNSTMLANFTMAANRDEGRMRNDLAEKLAQQKLNVLWQTGDAAQNYRASAASQNTALSENQLNWMNSTNAPFPDAGLYSQLAAQYGMQRKVNPYDAARMAGGSLPTASPGLLPSTMSGRPAGGYGPTSPAFYGGGGYDGGGPSSGASISYNNPSLNGLGAYAALGNTGYASPLAQASYGTGGYGDAFSAIMGGAGGSAFQMGI